MSQRLQVLPDETELNQIRQVAAQNNLTVAAWVRGVLREATRRELTVDANRKRKVIRAAAAHECPAPDVEAMLP